MDVLNFGSFNQFRDLVTHKSVVSLKMFRDNDGNNLLMLAAKAGKLEYVKFLIDKGFEVNSVNVRWYYSRKADPQLFILRWDTETQMWRII